MTERRFDSTRCNRCGRRLDDPADRYSDDCGGDCVLCMAECGDPDCASSVLASGKPELVYLAEMSVPADDSGGTIGIKYEDGGQAAILYHPDDELPLIGDDPFFVQLHSWIERGKADDHKLFNSLKGKRIRIAIQVLE